VVVILLPTSAKQIMIKAIIFDCFGVVFTDDFAQVYEHFGGNAEQDKEYIADVYFRAAKGTITHGADEFAAHLGVSVEEWDEYYAKIRDFDYELLAYIKNIRTSHKVSILSNISKRGLGHYMDYSVLDDYFDDIVESAKIGYAKPEARAYEVAAERLGVRLDECLFIDDRESYVEGATHVGMRAVLYKDVESLKKEVNKILLYS
jgi:HAD superfamily hydrolase (TIGR01509 family)